MKLIGIEEHYLTVDVRGAWDAMGLAATDPSAGIHSTEIERRLLDLTGERIALMDETGLDVQVLSLTTPALHDLGLPSVDLARRANDMAARAIAQWPERLQALATLPIATPYQAALELERCVQTLGFKGVMLSGRVGDRPLDHPDFHPVFACAETLGVPVLDAFDEAGVDLAYEIHPGEDLHDGASFERFLDAVGGHRRASILYDPSHFLLQQLDYLDFIDRYHERIRCFHVKDAEFRPNGRNGVYGGYQDWTDRAGRFRSLGDGQIDFGAIFSKLTTYDFPGWAVLEWECALKHPEDGAREGAQFIRDHIIRVTPHAFDDFAAVPADSQFNRTILGLS
jgi:hypothetical protein